MFGQIASFVSSLFLGEASEYESATVLAVNISRTGLKIAAREGLLVRQVYSLGGLGIMVTEFTVPAKEDPAEVVRRLAKRGGKGFMLNHYYNLARANPPDSDFDPGRQLIGWPAHCRACSRGIRLGMVDGPVNDRIPALAGQRIVRRFFFNRDVETDPGHGTAIAALLAGKGPGFTGLLPGARFFVAVAFTGNSEKKNRGTALSVVRALDWLVDRRVMVINASFTGPDNPLLRRAVRKIIKKRIPVVAAAGNHGPDGPPLFPAAYDDVIAVTAVDRFRRPFAEANQGTYIDFAAPGVQVPVPCRGEEICYKSGTSYAAPYCTALIARLLRRGKKKKSIKVLVVKLRKDVEDLGPPGRDPVFGWGLVRCGKECRGRKR